jgi:hypothetical protein
MLSGRAYLIPYRKAATFRDLKVSEYDLAMAGLKKLHAELVKDRKRLDWLLQISGDTPSAG